MLMAMAIAIILREPASLAYHLYSVSSPFHSSSPVVHRKSGLSVSNSSIGSCIGTTAIQDLVRTACPHF